MPFDITLEKTLPHNLEAERSLLGAILLDEKSFNHVAELLKQEDFYAESHRKIYAKMEALSSESKAIDFITLKNELEKSDELEAVGGAAYLASLTDGLPRITNIEHYAKIVKEKSILRKLIFLSNETMSRCYEREEDVIDILESTEKSIFEIAEERVRSGFLAIKEIIKGTFKDLEALYDRKQLITGVATGFAEFDLMTSGLQPSDLIVVAARPGLGKTSFCLNIAQYAALKHKKTVGVFSLEMSASQLIKRVLCAEARVDAHKFRSGYLSKEDWNRVAVAMSTTSEAKIFIDDMPGISLVELRSKARRLKAEHDLDLVIIDYLQLMSGRGKYENRTQEISAISRTLKGLAKELNIPVIAISQLSRAPEQRRGDHRPQLSDLRESGCLGGDTLVYLPDLGIYKPIEQVVGQENFRILALDTLIWKLTPCKVSRVFATGIKPVYRLVTRLGRTVRATANHKFLTIYGWKRLDELAIGSHIALPRYLPSPVQATMTKDELALLGHQLAQSDVYWDEIATIGPDGTTKVYDLTVENIHNFVANDIVVHNSIEQDADMVVFIYREEIYNPGEENQGIADIIIAKQRNGPTGSLKLAFIKEYTKFENLWRED